MIWAAIARVLAWPPIADRLIERAKRTPYRHIASADGQDVYMGRFWLFNPYPGRDQPNTGWRTWLPSVRIHHICREDRDRHLHDHPWHARTVILRGRYVETRQISEDGPGPTHRRFMRQRGDTATLRYGEFHRIDSVSPGGVWTLFITYRYRGTWGFKVDGKKIPWRDYL